MKKFSPTKIVEAQRALISEMQITARQCTAPSDGQMPEVQAEQGAQGVRSAKPVKADVGLPNQTGLSSTLRPILNSAHGRKSP